MTITTAKATANSNIGITKAKREQQVKTRLHMVRYARVILLLRILTAHKIRVTTSHHVINK